MLEALHTRWCWNQLSVSNNVQKGRYVQELLYNSAFSDKIYQSTQRVVLSRFHVTLGGYRFHVNKFIALFGSSGTRCFRRPLFRSGPWPVSVPWLNVNLWWLVSSRASRTTIFITYTAPSMCCQWRKCYFVQCIIHRFTAILLPVEPNQELRFTVRRSE